MTRAVVSGGWWTLTLELDIRPERRQVGSSESPVRGDVVSGKRTCLGERGKVERSDDCWDIHRQRPQS